jgi:hypothetical protein
MYRYKINNNVVLKGNSSRNAGQSPEDCQYKFIELLSAESGIFSQIYLLSGTFLIEFCMTCIGNCEHFRSCSLLFGKRFFCATNSIGFTILINLLLRDTIVQYGVRSECGKSYCVAIWRSSDTRMIRPKRVAEDNGMNCYASTGFISILLLTNTSTVE